MAFFSYALGAVVLILVLLRQARPVAVPRVFSPRLPVFLGVIGLFTLTSYAGDHHTSGGAWAWVLATLLVGAVGVGALRGLSMRVRTSNGWVLRQGTTVTMALWLVSVLLHLLANTEGSHAGGAGLVGASFLLYLGLTLGVQYYVVHRRAQPLWAQLGPDAGRPLVNFIQGFAQGPGVFFTAFGGGPGAPGTPGAAAGQGPAGPAHGGDVIDVEVVEDTDGGHDGRADHGPPELRA